MSIFQKVTLKNLKENKTRTLVTIIGILLSAAMFTAVTVSISSLQHFLISYTIHREGSWQGAAYELTKDEADALASDEEITDFVRMQRLGYALLPDCENEDKPYLCVYSISENFTDLMPVHLTEGHMPENSSEILLPDHLSANGGVEHQLGDTLSLDLGTRTSSDGYVLNNHNPYSSEESDGEGEQLTDLTAHTYTVVGFYERPAFEDFSAPGYTALTVSETGDSGVYDVYFCLKSASGISAYIDTQLNRSDGASWTINYDLLRLYGYSGESSYNRVLFSLGTILIAIIVFGSISLIYNAFSISVSERTRQFGLLASIGATRQQLTGSVLFEALFLAMIGIPLGILCGIMGIGITFHFTGDMIANYLYSDSGVTLSLYPSVSALLIAVLISLVTILVSAWLPAKRATKGSAIEAIRQNRDIAIRSKKVKTSKLTLKLFGFHGMLATKNYKRNRKKYRATVISLFLSIVLFISASSFCAYLMKSAGDVLGDSGVDISYYTSSEEYPIEPLRKKLSSVEGITDSSYSSSVWLEGSVSSSSLSKAYLDYQETLKEYELSVDTDGENTATNFYVNFIEDETFKNYLKENGLSETDYFDTERPTAVMMDSMCFWNGFEQKYYTFSMLSSIQDCNAFVRLSKKIEGYENYGSYTDDEGNIIYIYEPIDGENDTSGDNTSEALELPAEECCILLPLNIGASVPAPPSNSSYSSESITLYYPYSMIDYVFSDLEEGVSYRDLPGDGTKSVSRNVRAALLFECEDHAQAMVDMKQILSDLNLPTDSLYDYAESAEQNRAMIMVLNIFSYGFIILISLIAAANVFNTISTNIILRKREFAMLKSMGLDSAGFRKMMNFECLLYGFKGLLYGLPVSVLITWFIYRAISGGVVTDFFIPWYSIVIAVGSVFLVVFATMLYSMQKVKKENIMDTLKDENI